jgi:predicted dienelactone hydrolase
VLRLLLVCLAVAPLASCASCFPSYCDQPEVLVQPEGVPEAAFPVGAVEKEIIGGDAVPLMTTTWYPAASEGGEALCYEALYPSDAQLDAPAACADGPRPVVVYTHGSGGIRFISSFLTEALAAHGYVVTAPDHTYNTALDADASRFLDVLERRPTDVRLAFDALVDEASDPESPLFGCVDEAAGYAVMGHSFGGYTAFAVAGARVRSRRGGPPYVGDNRVWAVFTMAPWHAANTIVFGTEDIDVPVMTITGERDVTTPWDEVSRLHAPVTARPSYLGLMPGGGHYTFTPAACLLYDDDGCGEEDVDLDLATGLINRAALLFFDEARGLDVEPPTSVEDEALVWDPEIPWL